ncbi:MAG: fimbria/pilus outer membrane usher protein [Pararobbsia sp.]
MSHTCRWYRRLPSLYPVLAAGLVTLAGTSERARAETTLRESPATASLVYLEVDLDGQRMPLIMPFRENHGHLAATGDDLDTIGLAIDRLGIAADAEVSLDSIAGLAYTYDAASQRVTLHASDAIRKPYAFAVRAPGVIPPASAAHGVLVNYEAFAQSDVEARLAIWSEARYFDPAGVLSNTGIAYFYRRDKRYLRYDTSWRHSNPSTLDTVRLGDMISSSLAWSRSIRMGGVQWRSDFALRPDLVTFPVPALYGSAVVPSSVDLYINQVRQFSGNVPSGPFVVNDVLGITGGGEATLVTRDALGRTLSTSVPLYIDRRLLAAGLSSYSLEGGFVRRAYGLESFGYDRHPALSGSIRHGLNDAITVEGHAETTNGLYNAGGGALVRLGMAGVVGGAFAASAGHFAGTQLSLGYQWIRPRFAIDAQSIRAFGRYGDLASNDGSPVPTLSDRVTVSAPLVGRQTVGLSYIGFRYPGTAPSHVASVSYSRNFGSLVSVNLSGYKDFSRAGTRGVFLSVSLGFGHNASISANVGEQNGQANYNVDAIRAPDYLGGWGWGAQAGASGPVRYGQGQVQYLGRYGEATAVAQHIGGMSNASLDLAGAVVWMDGSLQAARRIHDGFALVSTDGVGGIPVLHENRVIGRTDGGGHLLVSDLDAYRVNRLAIDSMDLPADARIEVSAMDVVPQSQSGVLARFPVARYAAASVILEGPDGRLLAPGTRVHAVESGKDTIVGYDGIAFIEDLVADNHLEIENGALRCGLAFRYVPDARGALQTMGPLRCVASSEGRP